MTDELHADAMKRKAKTEFLIGEAHFSLTAVMWINPNDYPVYLGHDFAAMLRDIQREAAAILAKHEEAEKELNRETG